MGDSVYDTKPASKEQRISMVGAMSTSGMATSMTFQGTMNQVVFFYFLPYFLCPLLKACDVMVMDNASVHKAEEVKYLIEATSAKRLYLPPIRLS